jgi:glycosyltransferase involved in cell wall biosynthesis
VLGLVDSGNIVGWVGRLSREKGADVMLAALARTDQWNLSIIGTGRERRLLSEEAEKLGLRHRVVWHGELSNAGRYLRAFDAFVMSSRTEGTPIVLFEAMYAKVPIIATRVGGVPDVLSSEHAVLVPPENPQSIADALTGLTGARGLAAQRAESARSRVVESFSPDSWIDAIDQVYRGISA